MAHVISSSKGEAEPKSLHVVLGAGPLGRAVAREALSRGHAVRIVSRSGAKLNGVEAVKSNAADQAAARAACAGASVVYQCASPPYHLWVEEFPPIQAGAIAGAAAAGAVLVAAENLYMYGPVDGELTEDRPMRPNSRKGEVRARLARALLGAHAAGVVRTTAGRAPDFFGPEVRQSELGDRFFAPLLKGAAAQTVGNPDQPHVFCYIRDFAAALVTLGEDERSLGKAWHVPSAPAVSMRTIASLVAETAGLPSAKIAKVPTIILRLVGLFRPEVAEVPEMLYQFDRPFLVSHARYAAVFGSNVTPLADSLAETVAWYKQDASAVAS
jgi:nucleoside-diphosphate-sugar epimerase